MVNDDDGERGPAAIQGKARVAFRTFAAIERVGNLLPHPFWLFCILAGVLIGLSAFLQYSGVSAVNPTSGDTVAVRSLLSAEGMQLMIGQAVTNFANFPPLATILTTMLGIAIAERSGLIDAVLRNTVTKVPTKYVTSALSMAAMIGHVAGDAAYVTLIPLGALVFRAVGKSPVLSAIVAFVSISAGYDASPVLTTTDVLLSSITTAATTTLDPSITVTPLANYFFGLASSVVIAITITIVLEKVLSKRPDLADDVADTPATTNLTDLEITPAQRKGMRAAGLTALVFLVTVAIAKIPANSFLRGEDGSILASPVIAGMAFIIGLFFVIIGWVYGRVAGTFASSADAIDAMIEGIKTMAPILVLFFAIAQFLAYFKWTGIGEVLAITGAGTLDDIIAPSWLILLGIAIVISCMNLVITSGSAMWSLAAPIFVPMLMLLEIPPETTQAIYRIADSVTNSVTPMSPYFVMALGYIQVYRTSAGIGSLASFTIPLAEPERGTTINVGLISGGSGTNVVAGTAVADIDIRIEDPEEMARVDAAFDAVESTDPRVSIMVDRGWNRPPMRVMSSSTPMQFRSTPRSRRVLSPGWRRASPLPPSEPPRPGLVAWPRVSIGVWPIMAGAIG